MAKEISRSGRVSAFKMVDDIRQGRETFNYDRPHTFRWIENKHLPIEHPDYFQIEVVWLDEEDTSVDEVEVGDNRSV